MRHHPITFTFLILLVSVLSGLAPAARGSEVIDAAAPYSAASTLRVQVTINGFLRFRVGAAAGIALVQFSPPAATVGNSTPLVGTGGGGAGPGQAFVQIQANRAQVTVTPTNSSGGMGIGTGVPTDGRISYAQISTASSDAINFPAPVLSNAGGTAVLPVMNSPGVTNRSAIWTYSYLNQTIPSSGTYGGVNLNGSRVTYTATMP